VRCENCKSSDEFFVVLNRGVNVHTVGGQILDMVVDEEQFSMGEGSRPFACARCGSVDITMLNEDIDAFWAIFGKRVDRTVKNPKVEYGDT